MKLKFRIHKMIIWPKATCVIVSGPQHVNHLEPVILFTSRVTKMNYLRNKNFDWKEYKYTRL